MAFPAKKAPKGESSTASAKGYDIGCLGGEMSLSEALATLDLDNLRQRLRFHLEEAGKLRFLIQAVEAGKKEADAEVPPSEPTTTTPSP